MLNRLTRFSGQRVLAGALLLMIVACEGPQSVQPYNETQDPFEQLEHATSEAENGDRSLLLLFGANWCPDCRKLDQVMKKEPVKTIVAEHFVVLKVDIGNWDRNLDFLAMWESPIASGIPAAVVANTEYDILYSTKAGELANARHLGVDELADFFEFIGARSQAEPVSVVGGGGTEIDG